ncbi:1-acyl-sn-glycerol-3-phosphate acyltransferase [Corynebacterium heidelbergense]|nr:lysophospholipid acyltransferase family protein [Corynebacterium heidelbergense]WCZ36347.1 1-acyl-sn-glycerol-3-phosphate acyltransferase [Corynebacterium heidelbergense]
MHNKTYWWLKHVFIGPLLWVYNRPFTRGVKTIPETGPVLLASNHLAVMDSFFLPLVCKRQLTFLAKKEYFTTPGLVGGIQKWFFSSVGQVPLDRDDKDAQRAALKTAKGILAKGDALGMYPEGTRSPDGRLYRGKTGLARIAMETSVPVYPVAMINTNKVNPINTWVPRPFRCGVAVGKPIDPAGYQNTGDDFAAAREMTDRIMSAIAALSGQEYVAGFYAADVKKSLNEGKGYPPGTEPGAVTAR